MLIRIITIILTIIVFSLSIPALAAEQGGGNIEGVLVNGTDGGSSVAAQDITLKTYLDDIEVDSTNTITDDNGRFLFKSLSTDSDYSYQVALVFQDAEYSSDKLIYNTGETSKLVEIIVYDSTTTDEAITVETAHTIIYIEQDGLRVLEYFLFTNKSDRTYVGLEETTIADARETLRFNLPEGATELQSTLGLMDCCIIGNEDGFIDTMSVLPGFKEVAYSYKVSHNSDTFVFSKDIIYPTFRYDLLFQGDIIKAIGEDLLIDDSMSIEGMEYQHLYASDINAGDTISVEFSGLPNGNDTQALKWVILVLVALTFGFVLIYFVRRKKLQSVYTEENGDQQKQKLLYELVQLDNDFEVGKIEEESYRNLHKTKKAQLMDLIHRQNRGLNTEK